MSSTTTSNTQRITVRAEQNQVAQNILTQNAMEFLVALHQNFNQRRIDLLSKREELQKKIEDGYTPDFLESTRNIRESEWSVAPLPADLLDRRVEITGPVERKMIINALNSGAKVFMADFEDSSTPSWDNMIEGQQNLKDAIDGTIEYIHPTKDKIYKLNPQTATLMVRPRGWHMEEKHIQVGGENMSGSLVDFGLFFFHNAHNLILQGSGPYFYLPKLENHQEARLWNDVFIFAQDYIGIPQATIKATVLIETILASFEMHEILYELKDHSAGLNCGRWDYIFSYIKKFRNNQFYILPDRDQVTMKTHFMDAYSKLVIQTCHKRSVHAMGGMAAQIPIKNDPEANEKALKKVVGDKLREVSNGHDGTWVAHPGLVQIAMDIFDEAMPTPNQIFNKRKDVNVTPEDLLRVPEGTITEKGVRENINVGILYIESWLRGNGAAAIYHKMEDAATAEISRTQIWQWLKYNITLDNGLPLDKALVHKYIEEELGAIEAYVGQEAYKNGKFDEATELFKRLIAQGSYQEFLTTPAYQLLK